MLFVSCSQIVIKFLHRSSNLASIRLTSSVALDRTVYCLLLGQVVLSVLSARRKLTHR